jgi:hypothetical protein
MAPGEIDHDLELKLESILPASRLSHLTDMSDGELSQCSKALGDFERSVSAQRRAVFDVIDRLQEEIVRRYRTGEATVDSLLP